MTLIKRILAEIKDDNVPLLAAGVTYYAVLAIFPALIAIISIYGLVTSPHEVPVHLGSLLRAMPIEARTLIITQLTYLTSKTTSGLTISAIVGILAALWGTSSGMRWLMVALTRVYDETETRKGLRLRLRAFLLAFGAIMAGIFAVALLVAMPSFFRLIHLNGTGRLLLNLLRWPMLAFLTMLGTSILYRFGPNRSNKWKWINWGSVIATSISLLGSAGLSLYTTMFHKFDKTYGTLAGIIVLLIWLYITAYAILIGGEVDSELQKNKAKYSSGRLGL